MHTHDVLIAGAGLVGSAMAIALGQAGLRVGLVDRLAPTPQLEGSFDGRVSAIADGSVRILTRLGVWAHLEDEAGPIWRIRVTDQHSPAKVEFRSEEAGEAPFGYMVENRALRQALFACLAELEPVEWLAPAEVEAAETSPEAEAAA